MILAGDIGGTKTNLAIFDPADNSLRTPIAEGSFPSQQHPSLESILDKFLAGRSIAIASAAFGIAGTVVDGRVETPNLPWHITDVALAARLGIDRVHLVNDLVANALGIPVLRPDQVCVINQGVPHADGNCALLSAGTGCGMAFLLRQAGRDFAVASEGGHMDFAPRNQLEIDLLDYLHERFERVSYDRVLSGPGLVHIYAFLRDTHVAEEPDWLAEKIATGDPGAAISAAALDGTSPLAQMALDMFASIYGAMAGNLALMVVATGGVYIGGGIAPKILKKLQDGVFLAAFHEKGRFSPMIEKVPIHVILEPKTALYGAARLAMQNI